MIKKLAAYSLILIANIVLLAHAVIPHHHHHLVVCIVNTHCHDDSLAHNHDFSPKDHEHDGNTNSNTCVLKQAVVIPTSQDKLFKSCDNCTNSHNHNFYILPNFEFADLLPVSEVASNIPELSFFITPFVRLILRLRAPPIA
jgi:hypothetical protein